MIALEVSHIVKSFADKVAVNDLSFSVAQGEMFSLIGPGGAGKTATIRMMMDIIKSDSGGANIIGILFLANRASLIYLLMCRKRLSGWKLFKTSETDSLP